MHKQTLTLQDRELLRGIVMRWDAGLAALLETLGTIPLTQEQREGLRAVIAEELSYSGLDAADEPNDYGYRLERMIDVLGYL